MHSTCKGIPDVNSPQCYNCKELSTCMLLTNNLKSIEKMILAMQQRVEIFCQNVIVNINELATQQNNTNIQLLNLIEKGASYTSETPKVSVPEYKQQATEYIETPSYNEEIIDANIKKSMLEKGKEIFGLIKA